MNHQRKVGVGGSGSTPTAEPLLASPWGLGEVGQSCRGMSTPGQQEVTCPGTSQGLSAKASVTCEGEAAVGPQGSRELSGGWAPRGQSHSGGALSETGRLRASGDQGPHFTDKATGATREDSFLLLLTQT